jgi:hypothetical protein
MGLISSHFSEASMGGHWRCRSIQRPAALRKRSTKNREAELHVNLHFPF